MAETPTPWPILEAWCEYTYADGEPPVQLAGIRIEPLPAARMAPGWLDAYRWLFTVDDRHLIIHAVNFTLRYQVEGFERDATGQLWLLLTLRSALAPDPQLPPAPLAGALVEVLSEMLEKEPTP